MKPKKLGNLLADKIRISDSTRSYKFHLKINESGSGADSVISGEVREVTPVFVRVRVSEEYRAHTDILLPWVNVLYIEENVTSSGGE